MHFKYTHFPFFSLLYFVWIHISVWYGFHLINFNISSFSLSLFSSEVKLIYNAVLVFQTYSKLIHIRGLPRWHSGKEIWLSIQEMQEMCIQSWVGKIPWSRKWQSALVLLSEKFYGQRSLVGYSPRGHRVGDNWGQKNTYTYIFFMFFSIIGYYNILNKVSDAIW